MNDLSPLDLYVRDFPERDSLALRDAWIQADPYVGMTPGELFLLGLHHGVDFTYGLSADPKVWPEDADPQDVIAAQTRKMDDSTLWMVWSPAGSAPVRVEFVRGRAQTITPVASGPGA